MRRRGLASDGGKLTDDAGVDRGEAAPNFRGAVGGVGWADARRHADRSTRMDALLGERLADRGVVLARCGGGVARSIYFARGIPSV